jgi:ribonuclease P protein component
LADVDRRDGPGSPPKLRRPGDIRRVMRTGAAHGSERVVVYVITGRRVGGAVARNRARRLLREAWRALGAGVEAGHDLVLVARGPFGRARAPELIEEIEGLFLRAGLIER